ncbi:MAG: efflux RND transporter periplasmic adaptor subunit, partial [Caulobacteraceae bacterium]|nr:efflux RND transporter periplasmic adaptor subunit [Caulobacteraceae bacterium]
GGAGGRRLVLAAPRAGVVTALNVSAGAQVSDPTQSLMTISSIDHVEVAASLAEDQIGGVRLGTPARITLAGSPGAPLEGRVSEIDPLLASDTRRQKVRIALANPDDRLLPGMYASVAFATPAAGTAGVTAPQSALLMNNDTLSVMVEVRPWTFQRRTVKIADETDTQARVVSGLAPGERIVVRGGVLLND